ncbi:MAG: Na+/H+ antiporter subunit E [Actinomycetota bacterium]|nr:Na+/H+ antiporter subunit E [Actinomycetota bacterium]
MRRFASLTIWAYAVWILLTWTRTAEQLLVGLGVALVVAGALAPLGEVVAPWNLLRPRRLVALLAFSASALAHVVLANAKLTRRIWLPSRPLSSGMVLVPTLARSDGELATVGLVTSLIVDNQIVDLDRDTHQLQYHAVAVPPRERDRAVAAINGPVERFLPALTGEEHR